MSALGASQFFRHNGLTIVIGLMFLGTYLGGQLPTGWHVHNDTLVQHGCTALTLREYLFTAHFMEVTSENWESEFLQMFVYIWITTFLFQKGSAESNDPDQPAEKRRVTAHSPWPVRCGGWWRTLYGHSLSGAFAGLFFLSFALHVVSSQRLENETRAMEGRAGVSLLEHLGGSQLWFESFQNWQSEFLAITSMVVLSIYLREKNSPESKPLEASHAETGD